MKEQEGDLNNIVFKNIQGCLRNPPLIIWGSGATIPFGMPSMSELNDELSHRISGFESSNINLELELSKDKYESHLPEIRDAIWEKVREADDKILEKIIVDINLVGGIKSLTEKIISTHPKVMTIVTTNYDRVLEYTMSYYGIPYTDGFNGKELSSFKEDSFAKTNTVNIIKVHGSLNWFRVNDEIRYLSKSLEQEKIIIPPGKNKYRETHQPPYRELIQKSDASIKTANSFLVVGFGFNDEHITPKIKNKVNDGVPIVLITKKITPTTFEELKNAQKYVLLEEYAGHKTKVKYKNNSDEIEQEAILDGDYWQLLKFMEII